MVASQQSQQRAQAAVELQTHRPDLDAQWVVESLSAGLTHLRDLLLVRVHDDVQRKYGTDSMLGVSLQKLEQQERNAKIEIEAYSCVVLAEEAAQGGYVGEDSEWFLDWMFRLRLGDSCDALEEERVRYYQSDSIEERRLKFAKLLQRVVPESLKAPLVLLRLYPRSLRILVAVAFGDPLRARELRAEQTALLPAIAECHECHGRVLDNDEICRCCGNPVWSFAWLLAD